MNLVFDDQTNWGKSYELESFTDRNALEYDRTVLVDYKDR
jgi:hypothetical protein